jgi:hypothetical protein
MIGGPWRVRLPDVHGHVRAHDPTPFRAASQEQQEARRERPPERRGGRSRDATGVVHALLPVDEFSDAPRTGGRERRPMGGPIVRVSPCAQRDCHEAFAQASTHPRDPPEAEWELRDRVKGRVQAAERSGPLFGLSRNVSAPRAAIVHQG